MRQSGSEFGIKKPYYCDYCGPVDDVESVCLFRGSMYQPPDYASGCPQCGRLDCVGENTGKMSFKVIKRYKEARNG